MILRTAHGRIAKNGDVLRIARTAYNHWGIYVLEADGGHVIHYSAPEGRSDFKGVVLETSLEKFMDGATSCEIMTDKFPDGFSGEETVARARSQIGRGNYDIWLNNCEHFAVWCKTGRHESSQTELLKPFEEFTENVTIPLLKLFGVD